MKKLMTFKNILAPLLAITFLCGCANKPPSYSPTVYNDLKSQKGIVIFQMSETVKADGIFHTGDVGSLIRFKKLGEEKEYEQSFYPLFNSNTNHQKQVTNFAIYGKISL